MFCGQMISSEITIQGLHDPVGMVLHQMDEMKVRQVPVSDGDKYLGLISEDDLQLYRIVDTADDAVAHIKAFYEKYTVNVNF